MRPVVKSFKVERMDIATRDPDIDALLPDKYIAETARVEFTGINNSIANAIRRAAASEIPVHVMTFATSALTTNNPFILVDMIQRRLRLIPIDQSVDTRRKFRLHVRNDTRALRSVYSREIEAADGKKLPFNSGFELFTLDSGQSLDISEITIETGYGYADAAYTVCLHSAAYPVGITPYDSFTSSGESTCVSSPTDFEWTFDTNGTIAPVDIALAAIDSIVSRTRSVLARAEGAMAASSDSTYTITLQGESATVGNLIMRNMLDVYPRIPYVSYVPASIGCSIDIKIQTPDDLREVLGAVIARIADIFAELRSQIEGLAQGR
jgi:DNA-directed RNA polymerase subunit L